MEDLYLTVLDSTALASSIYVNIALAGFTLILIAFWSRSIVSSRARLITYATMMISVVSISSYMGLASGLTIDNLVMPEGHALAGEETLSLWGRYLTWTLSTPFILLAIGLLAGSTSDKIFSAIVLDVFMCLTGLAAALTTSSYAMRWFWYLLSSAFFVGVLYYLLVEWPKEAEAKGTGNIFNTLKLLTVFMWLGYPIIWALGNEGLALLDVGITSWGYSFLDIIAKYAFTIILVLYVKKEPESITSHTNVASAAA
jgi:halorhodopsin